jgi:predicted dehydrogenase
MEPFSRRTFLKKSVGAAVLAAVPSVAQAYPFSRVRGANDDIRIAVIGLRGKGSHHIELFKQIKGVRIVALCDADRDILSAAAKKFFYDEGLNVDAHVDLRDVLERRDIDAIVTATPNHWHSLLTVWACQAGKDVYVEKPVSHEIWEGRKMVEAAKNYNRIVQAGTQSRSDEALHDVFAYIHEGNLGPMRIARGFCYKRRASIGNVYGPQPLPPSVDYNLWAGPAPLAPITRKSFHYDWHWFWYTGNGDIGNQGIHEMDMCRWAIGHDELPERVMSIGGRFGYIDDGQTPNTQIAFFDYKPVPIIFEVRGLPSEFEGPAMPHYKGVRIGIVIECENGYFAGGAGGGWVYDNDGNRIRQFKSAGGGGHQQNFIDTVRSRRPSDLAAPIVEGHTSSALCHMANISHRIGSQSCPEAIREVLQGNRYSLNAFERFQEHLAANHVQLTETAPVLGPSLQFDPAAERFVGDFDEQANTLLRRNYRKPFVINDVV